MSVVSVIIESVYVAYNIPDGEKFVNDDSIGTNPNNITQILDIIINMHECHTIGARE
jgi:hypothetical protein